MSSPSLPPAGWYPDPEGQGLRWWNGRCWTEHRCHSGAITPPVEAGEPPTMGFHSSSAGISGPNRNPTPMDAWNGLMAGGRWVIVTVLLFAFVALSLMLVATLAGASSTTAQDIAAKVILYGGLALIGFRLFFAR